MAVRNRMLLVPLAAAAMLAAPSAWAQADPFTELAELNALVDASTQADAGIRLARRQIFDGELTGAAATLERVLMNDPRADAALLLHAALLCRLDDKGGAAVEIAYMRGIAIAPQDWAEVTAACGPMPRPGGRAQP